jgi:hypothetical protein
MPLHDYYDPVCNAVRPNVYVPVAIGATAGAPTCETCGQRLVPIPAAPALHYGDVKGAAFHSFDTFDGRGQRVHVDSLQKLRRVEKEAEQAQRNGEGQPMVFRRWSQDCSNNDQSALHPSLNGGEQPTREAAHKFGSTLRKSATEPDHSFGPGVSESNASALPMSGKE